MRYAATFLALAAACVFAATQTAWPPLQIGAIWCAVAFGGVGLAYAFVGPRAFGKREAGTLPLWSLAIYAPYYALNALSLAGFRRGARENAWDEIAPDVHLGCRLNESDEAAIEKLGIASVLDLTSEFGETASLRALNYRCIPLLDTRAPTPEQLRNGAAWIVHAPRPIYVHCALGHGRSATFVAAYLMLSGAAISADEAIALIKTKRPHIGLKPEQMVALAELES